MNFLSVENIEWVIVTGYILESITASVHDDFGSSLMNPGIIVNGVNIVLSGTMAGSYVVAKIYGPASKDRSEIDLSHAFLAKFSDSSGLVGVSKPLLNIAGKSVGEINIDGQKRFYALFPVVEGVPPALSVADSELVGRGSALLHSALAPLQSDQGRKINPEELSYIFEEIVISSIYPNNDFKSLISRACRTAGEKLSGFFKSCTIIPVHGDLNNLNCRIKKERVNFFDFDDCGFGCAAYDLSAWVASVLSRNADQGRNGELIGSFLKGYQSVTPIAHTELFLLPEFTFLSGMESLSFLLVNSLIPDHFWPTVEREFTRCANIYVDGQSARIIKGVV